MNTTNHTVPIGPVPAGHADDPDIRILRRVSSLKDFPLAERGPGPFRTIAIVDTETTGTDPMTDQIIDVAVVTVVVDGEGRIVDVVHAGSALRDPGVPIPPRVTMLTGITDQDVAGKRIDLELLEARLASASVRIAHHVGYDSVVLERLMPGLAGLPWACSLRDFDWLEAGFDGRNLGYLLAQIGRFNTGHRAMADVIGLMHLLAHQLDDGSTVIGRLLENAERPTMRVEATGSGFDKRAMLKARGYHWDARKRVWWTEVAEADLDDEDRWLRIEAGVWKPHALPITWCERHR